MSGHSKWSKIKRKKGVADQKRGQLFSKLIREITVSARVGGANPDSNIRLAAAIERAKAESMPADNIDRAVQRGAGTAEGAPFEDVVYEGYGPAGVAVLVEAQTESRNRTTAAIRHVFSKNGGNLGETGCVGWLFKDRGIVLVEAPAPLRAAGLEVASAEATKTAETAVPLTGKDAQAILRLVEALEAEDDVQRVHANFDISAEELEAATIS